MNCRTESIFFIMFSMMGRGLRTTALNEFAGSYQINCINKKWVWDGYLIALRYRLFIQSYIHIFIFITVLTYFFEINSLCFIYIYIYIYIKQSEFISKKKNIYLFIKSSETFLLANTFIYKYLI